MRQLSDFETWLGRNLARVLGKYVEVDTPTLKYRAYIWAGYYWFVP